jgi:hypothetical protein
MRVACETSGRGHRRLELGNLAALGEQTIEAQIETVDGSPVAACKVGRPRGRDRADRLSGPLPIQWRNSNAAPRVFRPGDHTSQAGWTISRLAPW